MRSVADDDLALLNACLVVEAELRQQAFAALERLLALLPPGGTGGLAEHVARLPPPAFAAAASALYELGWIYDASR